MNYIKNIEKRKQDNESRLFHIYYADELEDFIKHLSTKCGDLEIYNPEKKIYFKHSK
jgi:hypothetical protein